MFTMKSTLQNISQKARFPTRYAAEFRKHFKGSLTKAINNIRLASIPTEHIIQIGELTTSNPAEKGIVNLDGLGCFNEMKSVMKKCRLKFNCFILKIRVYLAAVRSNIHQCMW